ncbi:MAG TPA: peptidase M54 [Candidatus Rokubacteria bacterium]|nr:peptidase M54 [Candidatus Rokubacteria bacterium]
MGAIYLWWIGGGEVEERLMEEVRAQVERVLRYPARVWTSPERPVDTLDPARGQHLSTRILRWLLAARPPEADRVVAVTDVDLFIPVLTFVFGEAQLRGSAAVVSTARLRSNPGAPSADPRVVTARVAKECIHELGHTFGLIHCDDPRCVMARSVSVPQVDAKGGALCRDCRIRLEESRREVGGPHG